MRFTNTFLVAALAFGLFAAETPARLDVTATPEQAEIRVDGVLRGTGRANLFDLKPGRHLVNVSAPSFRTLDESVLVPDGEYVQKSYALAPEKALVLLKTEPAGADVRLDGASLGMTPLLLTTLDAGRTYAFELALNGYRARKIEVTPAGRRPIARTEALVLDSGTVSCASEPAGAEVFVNGVSRGVTPVTVERVPKGVASVRIVKEGYQPEVRELRLEPGESQTLSVALKGLPARVTVVSVPEQGRVFMDNDYQGKAPVTFSAAAGEHTLRVEQTGCAPITRKIEVTLGQKITEEFKMENVLGRLEVITTPPGARVFVDGKSAGTTRARPGSARSVILPVEKVEAGLRTVVARADGFTEVSRKVTVKSKETTTVHIVLRRLFVPDTEIETAQGTVRRGVLVEKGLDGYHLETAPGVEETIPESNVRKVRSIRE